MEIKDYHKCHNNQVKIGLWDTKLNAVNNYIINNKLRNYLFITPKNWDEQLKQIILTK